jgi:hypothetical protein
LGWAGHVPLAASESKGGVASKTAPPRIKKEISMKIRQALRISILFVVFGIMLSPGRASAQCRPGEILVGEDDHFWYCERPESETTVINVIAKSREEFQGPEYRYRKAVIEAVADLMRRGITARNGGKIRLEHGGKIRFECVAKECKGLAKSVDCSSAAAYGQLSACLVARVSDAAFEELKVYLDDDAAAQAAYFERNSALIARTDRPTPGDLVFFRDTAKDRAGITHVAIFIGTDSNGRMMILHASSPRKKVLFSWVNPRDPNDFLGQRIVGYGDTSRLYMGAVQHTLRSQ